MPIETGRAASTHLPSVRTLFLLALAAATVGPLVVSLVHVHTQGFAQHCAAGAIRLLNLIAAPHVVTTLYLLIDRRQLEGVSRPLWTVYLGPAALIAACFVVLLATPPWAVAAFMLFFVFYSMWHFGRQNVGIAAFGARVGGRRTLDRLERWTLNAATLAGVLAAYRAFAPALMLPPDKWPFDLAVLDPILSRLWYLGIALYVVLVPATLVLVARHRRNYPGSTLVIYLGCVFFFLPTYLSDNGLFLITSFTVAHGVQYLVMLAFHASESRRQRPGLGGFAPLLSFGGSLAGGVGLWLIADRLADTADPFLARFLIATTIALTLAHYWIDQFLWRFSSPARRAWLANSYSFVGGANQGRPRPA